MAVETRGTTGTSPAQVIEMAQKAGEAGGGSGGGSSIFGSLMEQAVKRVRLPVPRNRSRVRVRTLARNPPRSTTTGMPDSPRRPPNGLPRRLRDPVSASTMRVRRRWLRPSIRGAATTISGAGCNAHAVVRPHAGTRRPSPITLITDA